MRNGEAHALELISERPQDIFDESAKFADVVVASFGRNELSAPHLVDIIAYLHRLSVGEKHMAEKGMPEDKAAYIVWRLMVPSVPFEEFQRHLVAQRRPEWNRAVRMIADAIRSAIDNALRMDDEEKAEHQGGDWDWDPE